MLQLEFRTLRADEIDVRAGQTTQDKKKIALLLYKNARVDMSLLDEVVGPFFWQREHKELKGVIYCGVSIGVRTKADGGEVIWITKWDAGTESNKEGQKGEASDSFKRACVNWGIGRELYTAPTMYVPIETNTYDLHVSHIAYNDKREIVELKIKDKFGNPIYQYGIKEAVAKAEQPKIPSTQLHTEPKKEEPQKVELTAEEQEELDCAMARMDFAIDKNELNTIYADYKDRRFKDALIEHGNNIKRERGWV